MGGCGFWRDKALPHFVPHEPDPEGFAPFSARASVSVLAKSLKSAAYQDADSRRGLDKDL
jgi:hypothetical protein